MGNAHISIHEQDFSDCPQGLVILVRENRDEVMLYSAKRAQYDSVLHSVAQCPIGNVFVVFDDSRTQDLFDHHAVGSGFLLGVADLTHAQISQHPFNDSRLRVQDNGGLFPFLRVRRESSGRMAASLGGRR